MIDKHMVKVTGKSKIEGGKVWLI